MTQNRSSAVMQQRSEPHDSLDYFPTPPWATRALCEWLKSCGPIDTMTAWEPAAGEGHMARPLAEYFEAVTFSDVHDYGGGASLHDFLGMVPAPPLGRIDWIITNPPFKLGEEFALRALSIATAGVALLVRSAFLESVGRYDRLFKNDPPTDVLQFTERVPMVKGRLSREATTATAYCWLVWQRPLAGKYVTTEFHWLPPCRARLERAGDYEAAP